MTQEEKQLLLQDLCARLPYGVKIQFYLPNYQTNSFDEKIGEVFEIGNVFTHVHCDGIDYLPNTSRVKPYLRPMYSMTVEEKKEFQACHCVYGLHPDFQPMMCNLANELNMFDWLNAHHFDYRGLIRKGLAIEAPERMYKID